QEEDGIRDPLVTGVQTCALPISLCSDATFLRRACLDITGTLPTPEEVEKFLADPAKEKRERVVDQLLARKEFVELWVMKFAELRSEERRVGEEVRWVWWRSS